MLCLKGCYDSHQFNMSASIQSKYPVHEDLSLKISVSYRTYSTQEQTRLYLENSKGSSEMYSMFLLKDTRNVRSRTVIAYQKLPSKSSFWWSSNVPVPSSTTLPRTILDAGDDKSSACPFSVASVKKCDAVSKVIFRKVDLLLSIPIRLQAL